jgi:5'-deoxynucleotidase YfbR-like HD superfamily hydrolase
MHEARIQDLNKLAARYIEVTEELEKKVEKEQTEKLPCDVKKAIMKNLAPTAEEKKILKDADYLECAFQAKEYADIGYQTLGWLDRIETKLQTKSAVIIIKKLKTAKARTWRDGLKKV